MKIMLARQGFALPTVLIASIIMLIVLLSAATASSSIRSSLNAQYYNQLAREAAESGMARASDCLAANAYEAQWNSSSPLRPNTSCSGGSGCTSGATCFVVTTGNVRTTFRVDAPQNQEVSQLVRSTGTVELLRPSNGSVWRTFTTTISGRVGIDLSLNTVVFGYVAGTGEGAYFFTIDENGELRGTGGNYYGWLGNGNSSDTLVPTKVNLPAGQKPASVFASFLSVGYNAFVITNTGALYGAGNNSYGQLGTGSTATTVSTPTPYNLPAGKLARTVGVLGFSTFVITTDNNIYASGSCTGGQLGTNYTVSGCANVLTPARVALPAPTSDQNTQPTDNITVDYQSAYVRMKGGRVYGWGVNNHGQLANGNTTPSSVPIQIGTFGNTSQPKATNITTDGVSIWIIDSNGKVWGAGYNFFGQLSDGTTTDRSSLVQYEIPDPTAKIVKVATDQWTSLVLTDTGEVWGTGNNIDGQLGAGTKTQTQSTPVKFILPSGVKAVDVINTASGDYTGSPYHNTYVIGDNGRVYGAGANDFGQLGDGTTTDRSTPVAMQVIDGVNIEAEKVLAGYGTAVILTSNQKIYTVGNNSDGQLGDGTTTNSSVPKANRYTNILPVTNF
ncbi:MAG TPA: hypothetical protein VFZ62_01515 [Candidatus Saccharimonadales bacterium]